MTTIMTATKPRTLWTPPKTTTYGRCSVACDAAQAAAWLGLNIEHNRHIRRQQHEKITRDINSGNWVYDGNPIRFDHNGRLIDGQHRLTGIMNADPSMLPVRVDVVYGLAPEAFAKIDSGVARTASDALDSKGFRNGKTLAAAAHILLDWDDALGYTPRQIRRSHSEIVSFVTENPRLEVCSVRLHARRVLLRMCAPSVTTAAAFLLDRKDPTATEEFFESIENGADLPAGDGRLLLIRVMGNYRARNGSGNKNMFDRENMLALWVKAWNMWRTGKRGNLLVYRPTESFPLPE